MQFKKYIKQRRISIQGLKSFKDTLPKNIKKVIDKKGHIYSETLNNWKFIAGENLFEFCYPKSFKSSNKFGVSTLIIMVKRGHEVDLEYSKKEIMDKMNNFFGDIVVKKLKFTIFEEEIKVVSKIISKNENVTNIKYNKMINNVKNKDLKKSLLELTRVFKNK